MTYRSCYGASNSELWRRDLSVFSSSFTPHRKNDTRCSVDDASRVDTDVSAASPPGVDAASSVAPSAGRSSSKTLVISAAVTSRAAEFALQVANSVLTCSVLTCSVLTCSVLTCSVLTCSVLTCSVLTCSVLTCSVLTCSVLTCSVLTYNVLTYSVLTCGEHH